MPNKYFLITFLAATLLHPFLAHGGAQFTAKASQNSCQISYNLGLLDGGEKSTGRLSVTTQCALPLAGQLPLHQKCLKKLLSRHPVERGILVWHSNDWKEAMAEASKRSPEWQRLKNTPRTGSWENGLFVKIANENNVMGDLKSVFNSIGYDLKLRSIEKMLEQKTAAGPVMLGALADYSFSFEKLAK